MCHLPYAVPLGVADLVNGGAVCARLSDVYALCRSGGAVGKSFALLIEAAGGLVARGGIGLAGEIFGVCGGKYGLVARTHHHVGVGPLVPADVTVGNKVSVAAPFVLIELYRKVGVVGVGDARDPAVSSHAGLRFAFLEDHLEVLHVVLPHRLLVAPGEEAAPVGLLIVHEGMFCVAYDASGLNALSERGAHVAALQAVLREVFVVTAGERRTVSIGAGRIPAVEAGDESYVGNEYAALFGKLGVPRCGKKALCRHLEFPVDAVGAVPVYGEVFIDAVDVARAVAAVGVYIAELVVGELIEEGIPQRIVVVEAAHIGKGYLVAGGGVHPYGLIALVAVGALVHVLGLGALCLLPTCGNGGARPNIARIVVVYVILAVGSGGVVYALIGAAHRIVVPERPAIESFVLEGEVVHGGSFGEGQVEAVYRGGHALGLGGNGYAGVIGNVAVYGSIGSADALAPGHAGHAGFAVLHHVGGTDVAEVTVVYLGFAVNALAV